MSGLESKVCNWIHEEFPSANIKVNPKDITRLITSKNGHIYIKLFSLLNENFKSKSKYKAIKEASSLMAEKKKRDSLKNELTKLEKSLANLLSAVHQEEKRLSQETRKTDLMKTKETMFKSLASALEMIKLFCESFSKHQIPKVDLDSLFSEEISAKNFFSEGSVNVFHARQRRKEVNFDLILEEIEKTVTEINQILSEVSKQRFEVPKISLDQAFLKSVLDHNCLSSSTLLEVQPIRDTKPARLNNGLSALKIISEYDEHRTVQENKLLDKLEQAHSRMQHLVNRLPATKT